MSGLRQRVLTAVVLGLGALAAIFWLPTPAFGVVTAGVVLAGGWEWSRLAGWTDAAHRRVFLLVLAVVLAAAAVLVHRGGLALVLVAGALWWLAALGLVLRYERSGRGLPTPAGLRRALAGHLTLVPAWAALVALHAHGDWGSAWVFFLAALVWLADIGAYFAGRRWGRRKLAPTISPGKTWEGVWGAAAAALAFALVGAAALGVGSRWPGFVAVCMATVGFSIVGDLFESMLKRQRGVKDSGSLLPGHGGVLDRLDSLIAAAPAFLLGWHGLAP